MSPSPYSDDWPDMLIDLVMVAIAVLVLAFFAVLAMA